VHACRGHRDYEEDSDPDGHNTAARNLRDAIELIADDAKVEVLDLFESTYGTLNTLLKQTYQGLVRYVPTVWSGVFSVLDSPSIFRRQTAALGRLRDSLTSVLRDAEPDVVVSCYPVYAHLIRDIFRDHAERPFRFITVVTDSISICSAWYRPPSDLFVVPNEATAEVLSEAGVPKHCIKALGFPVSPLFAREPTMPLAAPENGAPRRVLYVINTGRAKAGKSITRLLKLDDLHITITVGRDATLKARLTERLREHGDRVRIYGWTNQMPRLLMSHHLVIAKAGGALVQEAIAARCPMIINQVIPGQEEGNARLVKKLGFGAVAEKSKEVCELIESVFAHRSRKWQEWRDNLDRVSRPDAALRIAELVLEQANHVHARPTPLRLFETVPGLRRGQTTGETGAAQVLLCDFHIHTNYSDGRLTLPEVIDSYEAIKDCIRQNERVSLTLYRDGMTGEALRAGPVASELMPLRPALPAIPA
jgi:processive 1,2-diacylglycerol beta-glucosyltransferase